MEYNRKLCKIDCRSKEVVEMENEKMKAVFKYFEEMNIEGKLGE